MSTLTRGGDQIIDAANDMRRDPSVILAASSGGGMKQNNDAGSCDVADENQHVRELTPARALNDVDYKARSRGPEISFHGGRR
jgi:hypothetical protein